MPVILPRGTLRVQRHLLPSERVVVAVRRHWMQVAEPIASTLGSLLVVGWLDTSMPRGIPVVRDVLWLGWLVLLGRLVWKFMEWRADWFVATDKRLLLTQGLLTRKVAMMPLLKVTDLSYNRSAVGRMVGYGEFVLESAGQDQALHAVNFLPSPDELYADICGELFGDRSQVARRLRSMRGED